MLNVSYGLFFLGVAISWLCLLTEIVFCARLPSQADKEPIPFFLCTEMETLVSILAIIPSLAFSVVTAGKILAESKED